MMTGLRAGQFGRALGLGRNFSLAPTGALFFLSLTHGLRRGLHYFAASRLYARSTCQFIRQLGLATSVLKRAFGVKPLTPC